jgi:hypothetical protein
VPLVLLEDEPVELGAEGDAGDDDELLPLGLVLDDDEVLSVEVELELEPVDGVVAEGADGEGAVLGDADGVVLGRSVTRSVRVSLQAVSRPKLSATAKMAVRNLFISMPPVWGCATLSRKCNGHAATPGLTGWGTTITNAAVTARNQRRSR